jgi:hypothetical protein
MNKHGSLDDLNRMMARMEIDLARPDPDDGAIVDFARGEAPLVQVGNLRGTAVAYTRHYGPVALTDQTGCRFEWFLGSQIKRIQKEGASLLPSSCSLPLSTSGLMANTLSSQMNWPPPA